MNKGIFLLLVSLLAIGAVLAAGSGSQPDTTGSQPEETGSAESGGQTTAGNGTATNTELETQNKGENSQIKAEVRTQTNGSGDGQGMKTEAQMIRERVMSQVKAEEGYKVYVNNQGEAIQVKSENGFGLKVGNAEAKSQLQIRTQENESGDKVQATLSNGRNAEIKVMPDTASETALSRLRLNVCDPETCTIELKEVGKGEEVAAAYEIQAEAEGKFLGLFKTRAKVKTQVNAETGEIIRVKKPFLTSVKTEE